MCACLPFCRRRRAELESSSDEREEFYWRTPTSRGRESSQLQLYTGAFEPDAQVVAVRVFTEWRSAELDADEALLWSERMVRVVVEEEVDDVYSEVQTASRRGVPDALKSWVLRRAQNCHAFVQTRPKFVAETYRSVFGHKTPDFAADAVVPTFSRGFKGTEEELHGHPEPPEEETWDIAPPPEVLHHASLMRSTSWTDMRDLLQLSTRRASREISSPLYVRTPPVFNPPDRRRSFDKRSPDLRQPDLRSSIDRLSVTQPSITQPSVTQPSVTQPSVSVHRQSIDRGTMTETVELPVTAVIRTPAPRRAPPPKEPAFSLSGVTPLCALLTPHGQHLVKKVLWTVNHVYPHLDFAPILAPLTCCLLCYLSEDETLVLLIRTLERSNELLKSGANRIFLTFRRSEFVRYIHVALAFCKKQLPTLTHHMAKINVDLAAWFARALQDGFSKLLPFDFLLRIYIPFIFEGSKVLLRYCLALLKMIESQLLMCESSEEANVLLLFRDFRTQGPAACAALNDLTKLAFRFQIRSVKEPLSKYSSHETPTPYLTRTKIQKYYRPRLSEASHIISDSQWEILWRWVPPNCRILDPELAYNSNRDGLSLKALNRVIWNDADRPMIFLIKTSDDDIIGGFAPIGFRHDADQVTQSMDLSGCFVYHLRPHIACYHWSGAHHKLMHFDREALCFGWNPPAIMLDSDLVKGHTDECPGFDSPRLVSNAFGDFEILIFEVWYLS